MTIRRWLFESQPDGTQLSNSNTPSDTGENLTTVSNGTGGAITYSSDWSFPAGGKSMKMMNAAGQPNQVRFPYATSHSVGAIDVTFHHAAEVPETRQLVRPRHASGYVFSIQRTTGAKIGIASAASTTLATGTVSIPLDYRLDITYNVATGSNSSVTVKVYNLTGTLLDTISVSLADLGAASYSITLLELFNSGATSYTVYADSVAVSDGGATSIGPYAPTVVAVANVLATRVSNTSVSVSWTHPTDAPTGVDILRGAGTLVNDASGRAPTDPNYDPSALSGVTTVATGKTASPYTDTVPAAGIYTYWVVRTP